MEFNYSQGYVHYMGYLNLSFSISKTYFCYKETIYRNRKFNNFNIPVWFDQQISRQTPRPTFPWQQISPEGFEAAVEIPVRFDRGRSQSGSQLADH